MYYNSDGMVRDSSSASLLDLTKENKTDIDLTLTEMRSVSGNIVLPSGVAPSGGISADIVVSNGKDSGKVTVKFRREKDLQATPHMFLQERTIRLNIR